MRNGQQRTIEARRRTGMSHQQIAEAMNLSESTIRMIESQALEKLSYKLWHWNLNLADLLGTNVGTDENAPFDCVEAHQVGVA